MTMQMQYQTAYSALRWLETHDPSWDYWYRHYPHFDENRNVHQELQSVSNSALGAAYRTHNYEAERRDPLAGKGRYAAKLVRKQEMAKAVKTYHYKIMSIEYADGHVEDVNG